MAGSPLDIRFTRGIDAQDDTRLVEQPFLLRADNVYFDAEKGPRKRSGYAPMTQMVTGAGTSSTLTATHVIGHQNEALAFDDSSALAYSDSMGSWINRGAFVPTTASMRPVTPSAANQIWCDAAVYNDVWEIAVYQIDGLAEVSNVYFSIRDRQSGGFLRSNELAATAPGGATALPRIVKTTAGFLIVYQGGDGIYAKPVGTNVMSSALIGAAVKVTSSTGVMDVLFDGKYTMLATYSASTVVQVLLLDPGTGAATATRTLASVPSGTPITVNLAAYNANATAAANYGKAIITYGNGNGNLGQHFYDVAAGSAMTTPSIVSLVTSDYIKQVSVVNRYTGASNGETVTVLSTLGTSLVNPQYTTVYMVGTGSAPALSTTGAPILGNNLLASRPFIYNGAPYAFFARAGTRATNIPSTGAYTRTGTAQGVALVANIYTGAVVAEIGYGVTASSESPPLTPNISGNLVEVPVSKIVKLVSTLYVNTGYSSINYYFWYGVRFVSANQVQSAQLGDMRMFSGGINRMYDGASVTEQGFMVAPEILDMTFPASPVPPSGTPIGVYQVCAVYEWTDRLGNLHRSAPGPVAVLNTTVATNLGPSFVVSQYPGTSKPNVVTVLYMTKAGGSLFYRMTVASGNFTAATGTVMPVTSPPQSVSVSAETLYTTGNILPNDPWTNSALMAASRNRIFTAGGEDSDVIYYSKAYVKGEGLAMPLAFSKRVGAAPGPITALATMDDKIVIFKARSIQYFYGTNGPGVDGSNDDFSVAQLLTTEVGCIAKGSVLTTADGVYFQAEKGIWLLSRSMNLSFVGQPIAPLTMGKTITSAVLTAKQTNIRFGTADGSAFVYHYRLMEPFGDSLQCGQWTTYSNYKQNGATLYRGVYTFARSDGRICVEQDGSFKDDAQPVKFTLSTAWMRAGSLLQAGQFTDVALLGSYAGPHVLLLRVHRDYSSGVDSVLKYATPTAITTTTWGSDPTWGGRTPFGGDFDDTYIARWRLPRGCTALGLVRFSISDEGVAGYDLGATCQILGLNLLGQAQSELAHPGDKKRQ